MNWAHVHLVLNHIPVVGLAFATVLAAYAWWQCGDEGRRLALGFLVIAGLAAVPVYFTGEPAEDVAKNVPGVIQDSIEEHEQAADFAVAFGSLTGVLAAGVLVIGFRRGKIPTWGIAAVTIVGAFTCTVLARTAYLGGHIRHSEINDPAP